MKWLLLLLFVLALGIVSALPICSDSVEINGNCTMLTPSLNCSSYDYWIYNDSAVIVGSGNVSLYDGSIYYLNFSEPRGHYLVRLCDDSSKVVWVTGGDFMSLAMIIILPLLAAFGLLYWASQLNDSEEYALLRLFFQLLFLPLLFLSLSFAVIAVGLLYPDSTVLIERLGLFIEILGYVMLLVGVFLVYRIFKGVYMIWLQKKEEKFQRKYG